MRENHPVIVSPSGCVAVDALVISARSAERRESRRDRFEGR